jgi:glutamyl-Q tRNA(Asp) synthetase
MKNVVTRFAPSPTGRLHLGHAYSALLAHDFARAHSGMFLLRIEDIDPGRSRTAFVDGIIEDLDWLGLMPDGEIVYQSERLPRYAAALERLRAEQLVYPCFCTRASIAAEIAGSAAAPHGPDGPLYPGTCRKLSADERARRRSVEPHAWRLDAERASAAAGPLCWQEGEEKVPAEPGLFGDVVLARKDAPTSYHLAVTLDDAAQDVSDVVRGSDLRAATHVHRLLQALLRLPSPIYHHHALLLGPDGERLAKRHNAPTIEGIRLGGADPVELAASLRMGHLPGGYSASAT